MISTVIYILSGFLISYLVARIFESEKDSENDNRVYSDNHNIKYDGKCERCGKLNGEKVFTFRYYNILCNRRQDKILVLD